MLIDIDKIVVGDRIRKDFGDIQELADDIKENTLLNPPVVTPNPDGTYTLIAGERRLKAMRDVLGYKQITVNVVSAADDERALLMEISENECRKEFTKTERLDYARRLARIEAARAKERQGMRTDIPQNIAGSSDMGESRAKVAQALGTNRETLRQEQYIEDNRELLDPADFADWDEGKLSTNKAYQRVKAAKEQAERERDDARETVSMVQRMANTLKAERDDARAEIDALEKQNDELYELANNQQVVEREVVRTVAPEDYEELKSRAKTLEGSNKLYHEDYQKLRKKNEELRRELEKAKVLIGEKQRNDSAEWDIAALTTATNNYLRQYGGKAWAFDQFDRVDDVTQTEFVKAITNLAAFAQNLAQMIKERANE